MKVLLHIGPHKTGTTAIQSALWNNRKTLLEGGILYPKACRYHYAQHRLSFSLKGMRDPKVGDIPDFETEIAALEAEIADTRPEVTILSSEEFFGMPPGSREKLRDALSHYDLQILAFVRNPIDAFQSAYNQNTKDPGNNFVFSIASAVRESQKIFPQLNFGRIIKLWADVFGQDRITLRQYETGDAITQFLEELDWHGAFQTDGHIANRSMHTRAVELIRLTKVTNIDVAKRRKLAKMAAEFFAQTPPEDPLTVEEKAILLERLGPGYDEVFKTYFGTENPYRAVLDKPESGPLRQELNRQDLVKMMARYL